jgi:hypothetical protein
MYIPMCRKQWRSRVIYQRWPRPKMGEATQIDCDSHGRAFKTYLCEHLAASPEQEWFSREADENNPWPDAWCSACDAKFMNVGEWNEENHCPIVLLCHHCYEAKRSLGTWTNDEDKSSD